MEIKLERLLLKREEVASILGFSMAYLQRVRENTKLHFPEPVYFFEKTSIKTTPFWKLKDIQEWVDKYQGLENG